jgi:hypothetical protein
MISSRGACRRGVYLRRKSAAHPKGCALLWKGIDKSSHHYALAVQRPNESNPLGVCCDIVKPVFSGWTQL